MFQGTPVWVKDDTWLWVSAVITSVEKERLGFKVDGGEVLAELFWIFDGVIAD